MPTILQQLDEAFRAAVQAALGFDADPALNVSQNDKFGDYQANAAMNLAKRIAETSGEKTNPRAIAERIIAKLELGNLASEVSIAGPGFINVRLAVDEVARRVKIAATESRLGVEPVKNPAVIVVDYSGVNVAKQMHVGHLRSTIIGDCIARVVAFQGHDVIRQNHIGDWGTQFGRVLLAIWMRVMSSALEELPAIHFLADKWREAGKNNAEQEKVVAAFSELVQRYVDTDPDGTKIYEPRLDHLKIDLNELESLYQFVSGITDHETASKYFVEHRIHLRKSLEELPRLVTKFLQNPKAKENAQERKAWILSTEITLKTGEEIYRRLGVLLNESDVRGESFYNDNLPTVVGDLTQAGIASTSEGATVVFVDGHKNPLIIQKSDGGYLYGTTDLAAIRFRAEQLHANRIIYTHDSRQAQHFAQVFAAAKKAGWAKDVKLDYAPFGTMLGEDGKPFKTRSGETVKLLALVIEAEERALKVVTEKNPALPEAQRNQIAHAVGIAGIKYADLSKDRTSDYVFSWDKMLAMEGNTGPYLQYAYARIQSIFRRAAERGIEIKRPFVADVKLESPFELVLAKHVIRLGEIIELVARELKPHHLCAYLYDLATKFSGFFENCPVLQSEDPLRSSRLTLCEATARTLATGLELLGIEHPEQM